MRVDIPAGFSSPPCSRSSLDLSQACPLATCLPGGRLRVSFSFLVLVSSSTFFSRLLQAVLLHQQLFQAHSLSRLHFPLVNLVADSCKYTLRLLFYPLFPFHRAFLGSFRITLEAFRHSKVLLGEESSSPLLHFTTRNPSLPFPTRRGCTAKSIANRGVFFSGLASRRVPSPSLPSASLVMPFNEGVFLFQTTPPIFFRRLGILFHFFGRWRRKLRVRPLVH